MPAQEKGGLRGGLYRLTGATGAYGAGGAVETRSYQPDPIGNLMAKDGVTYTYPQPVGANPPTRPHAVASGSNGFSAAYDANGNMVSRHDPTTGDDFAYTYDFENRLSGITDTTTKKTLATYSYDGDGGRVAKVTFDAKTGKARRTLYIGKLYEVRPEYLAKHYFAGATRIATAMLAGGTDPRSFNPHPGGPLPPGTRVPNVLPSWANGQPHQSPVAHGRGWACGIIVGTYSSIYVACPSSCGWATKANFSPKSPNLFAFINLSGRNVVL